MVAKASKLRSFEASKLRLTIDFHHFPLHFPHHFHPSSENCLFSIFVLFLWYKKVAKNEENIVEEHNEENDEENDEESDENYDYVTDRSFEASRLL